MKQEGKPINAVQLKANGGNVAEIDATIKGTEFTIEDVHDSRWQYEISYVYNGLEYAGSTSQYIHWAPKFVMGYFDSLFKDGGRIKIRIDSDDPSSYDADMDYAIAMAMGADYGENAKSDALEIVAVPELPNCAEMKVKGRFDDETGFTKAMFGLLARGYDKFIFNLTEVSSYGIVITGAIGWAQRYARAFTCDNKYAVLKTEGGNIGDQVCRIVSESREDIIDKFATGYMTEEERKAADFARLTEEEKAAYQEKEMLKFCETFGTDEAFADQMTSLFPLPLPDNGTFADARKMLEGKTTLTKEEEDLKKSLDAIGDMDFEEERRKIRKLWKDQWNQVMADKSKPGDGGQ